MLPLIAMVIVLVFAVYNLLNDQQKNSSLLNSGTMLSPSSFSGRATCRIPTPDFYNRNYSASDNSNNASLK